MAVLQLTPVSNVELSLVSRERLKELGKKQRGRFRLVLAVKDNTQRVILNRIISDEYKIKGSQIVRDRRTSKWFFLLTAQRFCYLVTHSCVHFYAHLFPCFLFHQRLNVP